METLPGALSPEARTHGSSSASHSRWGSSSRSGLIGGDMPARETESRGLGAAARLVGERISSIVRLELELAALEVSRKIKSLGLGIGLAVGALIALFFMVGFAYA